MLSLAPLGSLLYRSRFGPARGVFFSSLLLFFFCRTTASAWPGQVKRRRVCSLSAGSLSPSDEVEEIGAAGQCRFGGRARTRTGRSSEGRILQQEARCYRPSRYENNRMTRCPIRLGMGDLS